MYRVEEDPANHLINVVMQLVDPFGTVIGEWSANLDHDTLGWLQTQVSFFVIPNAINAALPGTVRLKVS